MILVHLAACDEGRQPHPIERPEQREPGELLQRVERTELGGVEEADLGRPKPHPIAHTDMVEKPKHSVVTGQDHVVEPIDPVAAQLEASRQSAEIVRLFVDDRPYTGLRQ